MGNSMTRATIIWFVGAAVVGAVAGGLHLLRSAIGGAHQGLVLAVSAFALTALAAAMLFHGVMLAAREQDAAAGPAPRVLDEPVRLEVDGADEPSGAVGQWRTEAAGDVEASSDGPEVYTFRGGKPVGDRSHRPARRDRSSRS